MDIPVLERIPAFSPDCRVIGGSLDPGTPVPLTAMRSRQAFVTWATRNGYEEGCSIRVTGIVPPPGRTVEEHLRDANDWSSRRRGKDGPP